MSDAATVIQQINKAIEKAIKAKEYGNTDVFNVNITAIEVTDKFKENIKDGFGIKKGDDKINIILSEVKATEKLKPILASIESVKLVIKKIPDIKKLEDFLAFFKVKPNDAATVAASSENLFKAYTAPGAAAAVPNEEIAMSLLTKLLYDTMLQLLTEYSAEVVKKIRPATSGGGSSDKKQKKVKGGFIDLDYDTQKMYNTQGLITELASLNAPSGNMNLNQPDPFSASGPSAGAAFETLPPNMIAGLTPNFSGGAKKSKKNLKHKRI